MTRTQQNNANAILNRLNATRRWIVCNRDNTVRIPVVGDAARDKLLCELRGQGELVGAIPVRA